MLTQYAAAAIPPHNGAPPSAEVHSTSKRLSRATPRESPFLAADASRSYDAFFATPCGAVSLPSSAASDGTMSEGGSPLLPTVRVHVPASARQPPRSRRVRHDPYRAEPATPEPRVVFGVRHQALLPHCRFIAFPAELAATPVAPVPTSYQLRVTQLAFELQPAKLRWLIATLAGVVPCGITAAGGGSFVVSFRCRAHERRVRDRVHRAALCDVHGVWAPRGTAEREAVERYVASREFEVRGAQLPRGLVACLSIHKY